MLNQQVLSTSACQYKEYQYHDTVSYQGSSVVVIRDTQNVLYRRSLGFSHTIILVFKDQGDAIRGMEIFESTIWHDKGC